ncbi:MAG: LapA family protein [Pseudomonadota bacterium]|nr:LapA family protein [Pseudomonadota bacterium]
MRIVKTLLLVLVVITIVLLCAAFITRNPTVVEVDLLFKQLPAMAMAHSLIGFFISGGLLGLLVSSWLVFKERRARLSAEKRLRTTSQLITGETP